MFLLNPPRIGQPSTTPCSFTIQNVPIKSNMLYISTNEFIKFTIQNVPIKFIKFISCHLLFLDLQYKMFLLNLKLVSSLIAVFNIYNTKCSY